MSMEMEYLCDDGRHRVGFHASGGFIPYRYELKEDAERMLDKLYPHVQRRVVPAVSICAEHNGVSHE
jgi:hypothetical protein